VRSSTALAGGVGETRELCGAVLAGVQAIGLRYGRVDLAVSRQPAMERAAALIGAFRTHFSTVACGDLVRPFPDMAGRARKEHCARIVAFVADWLGVGLDGPLPGQRGR
jgi:C_GCAxxG_C_C family probable redox protein